MIGKVICTKYAIPFLRKNDNSSIVNIASKLGTKPCEEAGIINSTMVSALELSKYNIRVNAVSPGVTNTPLAMAGWTEEEIELQKKNNPLKRLGVKLYKCDPYCSFQRGSNERSNALVRRYLPKGTSFKITPQIYLDDIAFNINSMPRKIFGFKSSYDIELEY